MIKVSHLLRTLFNKSAPLLWQHYLFMTVWYRQFHMRANNDNFKDTFKFSSVMMRLDWSLPRVYTTEVIDSKYANTFLSILVDI